MAYLSKEAVLNSDGTNVFNLLQQDIKIKNDKLIYTETDHRLKYIHIIMEMSKIILVVYTTESTNQFYHFIYGSRNGDLTTGKAAIRS